MPAKNVLLKDTDIKRPGEEEVINLSLINKSLYLYEVLSLRHDRNINKMLAVLLCQELVNLYTSYRTFDIQCISK